MSIKLKNSVNGAGISNLGFNGADESMDGPQNGDATKLENSDNSDLQETTTSTNAGTTTENPTWGNSIEFLFTCVSMSVGLGNIWRFPFIAYENGGGAFLIPYVILLIVVGRPMYYMEMAVGQFSSRSSVKIWSMSPILTGIGIGQAISTICVISYYSTLIALNFYYMFHSMRSQLPWDYCKPEWGPNCVDSKPTADLNSTSMANGTSSSEFYFVNEVLNEKKNISDGIGAPGWELCLWLILTWALVFLTIAKGIASSGKAAYFLAIFPYVVMTVILIKAATLEGAGNGILFFIKPEWSELYNPKVWYMANAQLFFSLCVGEGPIIMFASRNNFNHNIHRDAMIVTTLDTFTSLFGGITVFAILGNLAHTLKIDNVGNVVKSGAGLAFISYPDTISKFPVASQFFAVIFFFMMGVLGLGSLIALHSSIVNAIWDQWRNIKYWKLALCSCVAGLLSAIIYTTPGGQWMLTLIDYFGGTFLLFVLGICEIVGIMWVYGLENFCLDVEFMTGKKVSLYWRICWGVLTPCIMIVIFVYSLVISERLKYSGMDFPDSALIAGWVVFAFGMFQIVIWGVWTMSKKRASSWLQRARDSVAPSANWGPKDQNTKQEWIRFKREKIELRRKIAAARGFSQFRKHLNSLTGKYD